MATRTTPAIHPRRAYRGLSDAALERLYSTIVEGRAAAYLNSATDGADPLMNLQGTLEAELLRRSKRGEITTILLSSSKGL